MSVCVRELRSDVKTQKKDDGADYKIKKKTTDQLCPGKSALTFLAAFVVVVVALDI